MRKRVSAPARLVELPPEHALANLGVLVESVPQVPSAELPLVKWRVRSTLRRRAEWHRRALRVAVVGALLFLAGGVVGAVVQPVLLSKLHLKIENPTDPQPSHRPKTSARPRRAAEPPGQVPMEIEVPSEMESVPGAPVSPAPATPSPSPAPSPAAASAPASASAEPREHRRIAGMPAHSSVAATPSVSRPARLASPSEALAFAPTVNLPVSSGAALLAPPPPSAPAMAPVPQPSFAGSSPWPSLSPGSPTLAHAAAAPAPAAAVAPRVSEAALLAQALRSLSIDRNPERALVALDEHARLFRAGALTPEAARLRTWALLLSGHSDAALAELDRQSSNAGFDALPGGEEYRVLRGELHARAGRWRDALADFERAVVACFAKESAGGVVDRTTLARMERALWGRASARSHLGDQAGAGADLREYLRRFPQGRFAVPAARLGGRR